MKTKINNKRLLNSNNYKKIVIDQMQKERTDISISGKIYDGVPLKLSIPSFTETVNEEDDIIREVINYFLRNNNISFVYETGINYHNGRFVRCGNDSRTLSFKLDKSYNDCVSKVLKKYSEDRVRFLEKYKNIQKYRFTDSRGFLYTKQEDELLFHLDHKNGKILKRDLEFLIMFLKEFVISYDGTIQRCKEENGIILGDTCIKYDDVVTFGHIWSSNPVDFSSDSYEYFDYAIRKQQERIEKEKEKQLSFEFRRN